MSEIMAKFATIQNYKRIKTKSLWQSTIVNTAGCRSIV